MAIPVIASLLAVGLGILVLGLRPRRVGTEPHCGRCEYNLTGVCSPREGMSTTVSTAYGTQPAHARPLAGCPECGTAIVRYPVRWGERRRRIGMPLSGAFLLLLGITGLYANFDRSRWIRRYPAPILLLFAKEDDRDALLELHRRYKSVELSDSSTQALIEAALDAQTLDPVPRNLSEWLALLDNVDTGRSFTASQRARYVEQVFHNLKVQPRVRYRAGERLMASVEFELRCGGGPSMAHVARSEAKGRLVVASYDPMDHFALVAFHRSGQQTIKFPAIAAGLGDGAVEYEVALTVSDEVEQTVKLTAPIQIVSSDGQEATINSEDSATAERLTRTIRVKPGYSASQMSFGDSRLEFQLDLEFQIAEPFAASLVSDVVICHGGTEFLGGTVMAWKGTKVIDARMDVRRISQLPSGEISLVLRHNCLLMRETAGLEEVFVGDLTLGPIAIEWPHGWEPENRVNGEAFDLPPRAFEKRGAQMPAEIIETNPRNPRPPE